MVFIRIEFVVVAIYLGLTMLLGLLLMKRNRGGVDYFVGGRAIPWWASGISLYLGNFSAWLFTGGAGMIYKTSGYGLIYFFLTGMVAYYLGSQITALRWRRSRVISPVEYTRLRFGVGTQQTLGIISSVVYLAAAGNQLRAIATVVHEVLDVPLVESALVIGAIVIFYTLVGGLWAVTVTDVVQCVVLFAITLVMAPLCIGEIDGGLAELWARIDWSIPPLKGDTGHDLHLLIAGCIAFTFGAASGGGPRFYCVPDEADARRAGRLAGWLFLSTPLLFSIPSLTARIVHGDLAALGSVLPGDNPHERVFVFMATEVLPAGLVGVFLAAMFAATMSALDSVYHQVAAVLSRDLFARAADDDRALMRRGRWMTVLAGTVTMALCVLYMRGPADLFTVMTDIFYLAAPVTSAPLMMGLFARKAPRGTAVVSMVWGLFTGLVVGKLLGFTNGPQVYVTQTLCLGVFFAARPAGRLFRRSPAAFAALALGFAAALGALVWWLTPERGPAVIQLSHLRWELPLSTTGVVILYALVMGASALKLGRRFAAPDARPEEIAAFYARLDTPVDRSREVADESTSTAAIYRLVGKALLALALLVVVLWGIETEQVRNEPFIALIGLLTLCALLAFRGSYELAEKFTPPGST
jgi:Na+/proline symporter